MLRFGGTVTLNGLIVYVAYNLDKVLLGRVWGPVALGYYGTATQLINVPTANLNKAVGGVTFSALSRLQHDLTRFRNYFLKGYALVLSMTLPLTVFAAMFAEDIVLVVLGPKWTEAVPIFRLLTPTILVFGMIDPLAWLLLSSGRQIRSLKMALVIAAVGHHLVFHRTALWPQGRCMRIFDRNGALAHPAPDLVRSGHGVLLLGPHSHSGPAFACGGRSRCGRVCRAILLRSIAIAIHQVAIRGRRHVCRLCRHPPFCDGAERFLFRSAASA